MELLSIRLAIKRVYEINIKVDLKKNVLIVDLMLVQYLYCVHIFLFLGIVL